MTNLWCLPFLLLLLVISGCDGESQQLKINNDDALLEMLRIGGLDLTPAFEITQKHYVSTADYSVTKISLQAWTKHQGDTVSINGKPLVGSGNYNLAIGNNSFSILVTSKDGIYEYYQLTVTRLPELTENIHSS